MDSRQLQASLDRLWAGIVKDLHFDPLANRITFSIRVIREGRSSEHSLVFEGVASFHYVNNVAERRLDLYPVEPDDYLELTSVWYEPKGVGHVVITSGTDPWTQQWWASANFFIEMWNHILIIEASRVIIDSDAFDVGYPPISRRPPTAGA